MGVHAGTILGPSIGGYFAVPAQNFPDTFARDGLFGRFPYLLPNLICAGLMAISIVAGYFCLEETHPNMQPWNQESDGGAQQPQHFRTESTASFMVTQATDTFPGVNLRDESYGTFNGVSEEAVEEEEWTVKPDGMWTVVLHSLIKRPGLETLEGIAPLSCNSAALLTETLQVQLELLASAVAEAKRSSPSRSSL